MMTYREHAVQCELPDEHVGIQTCYIRLLF